MMLRASLFCLMMLLPGMPVQAETSDQLQLEHSGLSLFMTAEEQLHLEEARATGINQILDEMPGQEHTEVSSESAPDAPEISVTQTITPIRYDGIVLKSGKMLDVWLDGKRVSNLDNYADTKLNVVDSTGQLSLSAGELSVSLYPGDSYPANNAVNENDSMLSEDLTMDSSGGDAVLDSHGVSTESDESK